MLKLHRILYRSHLHTRKIASFVRKERSVSSFSTTLFNLKFFLRGFTSDKASIYGKSADLSLYWSDYEQINSVYRNGLAGRLLSKKEIAARILDRHSIGLSVFGIIRSKLIVHESTGLIESLGEDFERLPGNFFLRPVYGSSRSVIHVRQRRGKFLLNGTSVSKQILRKKIGHKAWLVLQLPVEAPLPFALRVMTLRTGLDAEPFAAYALLEQRNKMDYVEIATGAILDRLDDSARRPCSPHLYYSPAGAEIGVGNVVPDIGSAISICERAMRVIPGIHIATWVLVRFGDNWKIVDARNQVDTDLVQRRYPLLEDPRVKRFYKYLTDRND